MILLGAALEKGNEQMIKCETCIYRKNCQFLATHKKAVVVDCETYSSEADLKNEITKEIFAALEAGIKAYRAESVKRIQYDETEFYKGKIFGVDEIAWFIRKELKPKYMEE